MDLFMNAYANGRLISEALYDYGSRCSLKYTKKLMIRGVQKYSNTMNENSKKFQKHIRPDNFKTTISKHLKIFWL